MVYSSNMDIRIRELDAELHQKFKMVCLGKGTSIQQLVVKLIEECVDANRALLPASTPKDPEARR